MNHKCLLCGISNIQYPPPSSCDPRFEDHWARWRQANMFLTAHSLLSPACLSGGDLETCPFALTQIERRERRTGNEAKWESVATSPLNSALAVFSWDHFPARVFFHCSFDPADWFRKMQLGVNESSLPLSRCFFCLLFRVVAVVVLCKNELF